MKRIERRDAMVNVTFCFIGSPCLRGAPSLTVRANRKNLAERPGNYVGFPSPAEGGNSATAISQTMASINRVIHGLRGGVTRAIGCHHAEGLRSRGRGVDIGAVGHSSGTGGDARGGIRTAVGRRHLVAARVG